MSSILFSATVIAGFLAFCAPVVLGNPIPPTPTPPAAESKQEASIPDSEPRILIVSGEDDGEERGTEFGTNSPSPLLPHLSQDVPLTGLPSKSGTSPVLQDGKNWGEVQAPSQFASPASAEPTPQPSPNPVPGEEQPADTIEQDIKDVENPIVDRISIPIANRTAFGIGPFERKANVTLIQPVLPISLGENYLVVRPSLPLVYAPTIKQPRGGNYGLGDFRMQAYFVPKPTKRLTWGIGPTFLFPTAGDRTLGFSKWGIGPAFVAVWSGERLTVGGRLENYWSVAGDGGRPNVSQLTVQPFATYILGDGWYLVSAPVITAFWNLPGEKWVLPIGGGIGKVMKLGDRPFNVSVQAYWQPIRPDNSEGWALVVQFQSLFPR